jgi:hypothetical protein
MIYISPDNQYPRHIGDIKRANPDFQEGEALPIGWVKVDYSEQPTAGDNQIAVEGTPSETKGVMTQKWVVRDLTQVEIDRRNAPANAKAKLIELGLTEAEITALVRELVR